jgi:TPP-dependent pyruvate/acetoin dehydrogenase alpha subunit
MTARFEAFGIPATHLDSYDVEEILRTAGDLTRIVRRESRPQALVIDTARLGTHSKSDDTRDPMKVEELWALRDPVEFTGLFLTDFERTPIQFKVMDEIEAAFEAALAMEGRPA